jgi:hypothetical protein
VLEVLSSSPNTAFPLKKKEKEKEKRSTYTPVS